MSLEQWKFWCANVLSRASAPRRRTAHEPALIGIEQLERRQVLSPSPLVAICPEPDSVESAAATPPGVQAAAEAAPFPFSDTFLLNSRPGATKTIYLDFNGHTTSGTLWNSFYTNGSAITTPAFSMDGSSAFSDAELERIQYIWQRVAEDFSPFDVNVTTQDPGVEALRRVGGGDTQWGVRVVIGGHSSQWFGSPAGGVAFVESFTWSSDTPAFVFADNLGDREKDIADAASHEAGHTLGLDHDGRTNPEEEYYAGHGSGETSWAPTMGVSYSRSLNHWSKGEYANASNKQDDLLIITSQNGFSYRPDDHAGTTTSATTLTVSNGSFTGSGVIERTSDQDLFKFTTTGGTFTIDVQPFTRGANLDVLAELLDSRGELIASSNPADSLAASITQTLGSGTYYVRIDGVGKGDPLTTGYSDYGSLGQYTISGQLVGTPADLRPLQLAGWSAPLVVSTTTGTTTDAVSIVANQPLFVDLAATNAGTTSAGQFTVRLMLDGQTVNSWTVPTLGPAANFTVQDFSLGGLSAGSHTLVLTVDAFSQVPESDEANNSYTKTITVLPPLLGPDLAPTQPSGWSGSLVVSTVTGTHTDASNIASGQTVYVDLAVINQGDTAVGSFTVRLTLNGQVVSTWTVTSLTTGSTFQIQDVSLGSLSTGTHMLTLTVDSAGVITESNEANNTVSKSVTVITANAGGGDGQFALADFNNDTVPDLAFIKMTGTASGKTELLVLNGATNYQSYLRNAAVNLHPTGSEADFALADFNRDGVIDLAYIKKFNTGSGKTELHVLDGASGYLTFSHHTILPLHPTGNEAEFVVGNFNKDSIPDLAYIKKFNTGSGKTELHVLSGATGYQTWIEHLALPLHPTGSEAVFRTTDLNGDQVLDLAYIKKFNTGSGRTELHVLNGASDFRTWLLNSTTALSQTGSESDFDLSHFNGDGSVDLAQIKQRNTISGLIELNVLNGASSYQTYLKNTVTALPTLGAAAGIPGDGQSGAKAALVPLLSRSTGADSEQSAKDGASRELWEDRSHFRPSQSDLYDRDAFFANVDRLAELLDSALS